MRILASLQSADHRLFSWCFQQGERRLLIPLAKALSHSGDGYLHVALPLLLLLLEPEAAGLFVQALLLALAIERPLYWVLKNTLKRRRPQDLVPGFRSLIVASDQFSFPSGHSSGAFLLATLVCFFYGGPSAVILVWASSVAFSRILLGVHFPGDTIAGASMGAAVAWLAVQMTGVPV